MNVTKRFAKNLKEIREKSGLSLREVAPLVGFGHATLNNYENGRQTPDVVKLVAISKAFKVPVSMLLEGCL